MTKPVTLSQTIAGVLKSPSVRVGSAILILFVSIAVFAPLLFTVDPLQLNPLNRMKPPSSAAWFGTDSFGRDIYSRVLFGARTSLIIGLAVVAISVTIGLTLGVLSGYVRQLDGPIMRVMDGFMAIPAILLAIALIAVTGASLVTVIAAITVSEVPRIVRLVRGVVLSVREEPFVEAGIAAGGKLPQILWKHILPSTIAPLTVMASFVASHAILAEALLSFLGAGLPPEIPSLGNVIAEGRKLFQLHPEHVFIPGIALSVMILGINLFGDGLRNQLDPRVKKRL